MRARTVWSLSGCRGSLLFPLSATEQRQYKQVCQDVDDQPSEHDHTETLRRRKIGEHENGKARGEDHVRVDNPAPLFFASGHPSWPAFLSIASRAANAKDKMNHRVDGYADANVRGRRRDDIHRYMQPADAAKHAEGHESQAHDHRHRPADGPGDDPRYPDKQNVQPEKAGYQTGSDKRRQSTLQIVNAANESGLESVLTRDRAKIVDDFEPVFVVTAFDHPKEEHGLRAIVVHKTLSDARVLGLLHDLHHLFVVEKKGERSSIAFCQESRE